jgi:bifunctional DNA-binding transcriptional regulator/antitoxin component of YhaV-PrlF toxin-antitoxin module
MTLGLVGCFDDNEIRELIPILIKNFKGYDYIDVRKILEDNHGTLRIKVGIPCKFAGLEVGDYLKATIKGRTIIFTKVDNVEGITGFYKIGKSGKVKILKATKLFKAMGWDIGDYVLVMARKGEIVLKKLDDELERNRDALKKLLEIAKVKYVVSEIDKDTYALKLPNGKEIKVVLPKEEEVVIDVRDVDKVFDYLSEDIEDL